MNTAELRQFSELALAGYGAFAGTGLPPVDDLKVLNGDPAGFSERQANRFLDRFDVAIPTFEDARFPSGSGNTSFEVTVFRGRKGADTGKLFISFRGVAQRSSSPSDLSAVAQIGGYGAAVDQIVAMHNWWLRVSMPVGSTSPNLVRQYEFSPLLNLPTRAADVPAVGRRRAACRQHHPFLARFRVSRSSSVSSGAKGSPVSLPVAAIAGAGWLCWTCHPVPSLSGRWRLAGWPWRLRQKIAALE